MTPPAAARAAGATPWLVIAGVLVAALSLRGPIVAPTPVLGDIAADLDIGSATAGLLTTAPVLMFALLTPLAAITIRRAGAEVALLLSLAGVLVGTFVRALPGFGSMLAGMVVIGASITIGNVVIPVIIRRDVPPDRVAAVTAAYAALLNVGSLITSLLTAPLAGAVGWTWALLIWSVLTLAGLLLWLAHLDRRRRAAAGGQRPFSAVAVAPSGVAESVALTGPVPVVAAGGASVLRRPVAWLLLAAFGGQTITYYALTTWLPTFAHDELGLDAASSGALASLYQGLGVFGALLIPVLSRYTPRFVPAAVICASWLVLFGGLLTAPEYLGLWLSIGAIGHAGGFVVIFAALVAVSRSDAEAAGMSAMVQCGGYVLGALGGPLAGALHEVSGGWTLPMVVLAAIAVLYCIVLSAALVVSGRQRR